MITQLRIDETVRLDRDRLEHLYMQLGPNGAEGVVSRAMEELAVRLAKASKCFKRGDIEELRRTTKSMVAISDQIGMAAFARVAGDVQSLCDGQDGAALAACMARLERIGENSLMAIWDLQDLSV